MGRENFGGKVKSLLVCAVCELLRHESFHGNLCPECEKNMRARGKRAWRKLSEQDKSEIAEASFQQRSARIPCKDSRKLAEIAEQVRRYLCQNPQCN